MRPGGGGGGGGAWFLAEVTNNCVRSQLVIGPLTPAAANTQGRVSADKVFYSFRFTGFEPVALVVFRSAAGSSMRLF